MASSSASNAGALRQRKGKAQKQGGSAPAPLRRSESWHDVAKTHVLSRKRYSVLFGVLIGVLGVFVTTQVVYFEQPIEDMIPIPTESMNKIRDKINALEWPKRVKDDLLSSFDYRPSILADDDERPGVELRRDENLTAYSPVVLIPGFTSTGLEIWNGSECSKEYFRQRMWGTARMLQQFMMNQKCWIEHVMLNRSTGLDPDGIKLRPANGLEAADYVIGGFWVWGKVIENLADIGYDSNNMFMAAYDWRMAPSLLEVRDQYFTKLKFMIEMAKASSGGRKVVLVTHSYATQVIYYFMKWVESENGGKQGPNWVDNNVEAFINIAGPTLGTIKSISALLSGEMKDTAELGGLSKFLGFFFGPPARARLARSWPSVATMLPFGGDAIWGTRESAPDDFASRFAIPPSDASNVTFDATMIPKHVQKHGSNGGLLTFTNNTHENVTASTIHAFLGSIDKNLEGFNDWFSTGIAQDPSAAEYDAPKHWINPLESTLPRAPNMKLFCFYGVGKPVERGYVYGANDPEDDEISGDGTRTVPYILDTEYSDLPWIKTGIRYVDGDGTVPLISLGFMCARGWREDKYNPGGVNVRIREYKHNPVSIIYDPRGGPATSDHVDIMGNHELIKDLLRVAARAYDKVPERIESDIVEIAKRVKLE
uniref:Phospholipid:diacylglycerol acyltransferase n=1 Tax=Globisporangium ultimum (strain ATCC 200006 / CBS 805.95 / DAOM BR144) TaxID=431595 RepID=K3W971_GLOUD